MSRSSRILVVVGGASGLGKEIVLLAAQKGYRVAILDTHEARAKQLCSHLAEEKQEHFFVRCDVRSEQDCRRAIARIVQRWGHIDVLFQAAGVATSGLVETVTQEQWRHQLEVNLLGTVNINQAALREMKQQKAGHIVNVAGLVGLMPTPSMSSYAATNAAVIAYSESLYTELAPLGIHVSVVCPHFFKSNLNENIYTTDPLARARFERLLNRTNISTEEVARRTLVQMKKKIFMIFPHPNSGALWRHKRWFPKRFYRSLLSLAEKVRPTP